MSSTLDEICKFYSGTGFPNKFQGKRNGKYPFVKVGDISRTVKKGNITLTKSQNYINDDVVNKINGKIVPKDTIIFAKIGEALKLNRRVITNKECLIDNNILGIKPKTNKIDLKYLFYFMNHLKLEKFSESTTVPSVRQTRLKSITINIPSIDEQLEIVNILENINKAVLLKREQLSKLEILIKARFVEMFGDPRGNNFKWKQTSIKESCTLKSGKSLSSNIEKERGDIPYIKVKDMNSSKNTPYITTSSKFVKIENVKKQILPAGTVIFPKRGGAIGTNKKRLTKLSICADLNIMGVIPNIEKLNSQYLFAYFNTIDLKTLNNGSSVPQINNKDIEPLSISLPPLSLQNEFANFVQQVDKSKVAVQKSLDETQKLYDSLMQEYFG
ncbi:restriction endonuclease subunit S [Lactobacillus johnsonii]|uniref:restriction endonuclease subunit S n=1 Tax=Lactobacillus johnsonii TaxID=33959 RepID=UPI002B261209|nr:restriction endonuclease subunit S [Lactobacillus johnsonii]